MTQVRRVGSVRVLKQLLCCPHWYEPSFIIRCPYYYAAVCPQLSMSPLLRLELVCMPSILPVSMVCLGLKLFVAFNLHRVPLIYCKLNTVFNACNINCSTIFHYVGSCQWMMVYLSFSLISQHRLQEIDLDTPLRRSICRHWFTSTHR